MTEKNKISQKALIKWGAVYALILALVNFGGYIIVITAKLPATRTEVDLLWEAFKIDNRVFIAFSMAIMFLIPFMLIAVFIFKKNEESLPGRIINLPLMYAICGSIGWILPYIFELICLIYLGIREGVNPYLVAFVSFFNVIQSAVFIGAFGFMTLDAIHRHFVLPKLFPNGKLEEYKGSRKLSTRTLIGLFYISVGLIPICYQASVLYNYSNSVGFSVKKTIYLTVFGLVIIGLIMLYIFSRYFIKPLKSLRDATNAIKNDEYKEKVDIVSCDDFGTLADNFNDMAAELDIKAKNILKMQNSIIKGMAVMVESRDNSTGGHIYRTSDCVLILVNELIKEGYRSDIDDEFWQDVIKAAPMHDLGKIAIDDAILRKPGKFTEEEYEIMKTHAMEGARIVENVLKETDDQRFKTIAKNVANFHHEKWNGSGYPKGLSREEIPLEARIMALADVFDALVSKRCYKDSYTFDKAFLIIEESLGTHFDPELGLAFLRCRPSLEELYSNTNE